jgi:hypothetical protein
MQPMKVDGKPLTEEERMKFLISIEREPPTPDSFDYVSGLKPRPLDDDDKEESHEHGD